MRCRPCDILSALNISAHGDHSLAGPLHIKLSTRKLRLLADGLGRPRRQLEVMSLARYDDIAFDLRAAAARKPNGRDLPQYLARHEWLYVFDTHACPQCLADRDGALRLRWKLPWSMACTEHQQLLLDRCPACDRRFGLTGAGRPTAWLSAKPHAFPLGAACAGLGKVLPPCIGPIPTHETVASHIAAAQATIDRALNGHALAANDRLIGPPEFIAELKALTVMLLAEGDPAIQATPVAEHAARLSLHYAERDRARAEGRQRPIMAPCPRDVSLLAAVIPSAVDAILEGRFAVQALMEPVAKRIAAASPRVRSQHIPQRFAFPTGLRDTWNELHAPQWQRIRRRGIIHPQTDSANEYSARHIPQLLWEPVFQLLFADMLHDWDDELARRFCSLSLARTGPCSSWLAAAEALDLRGVDGRGTGTHFTKCLDAGPRKAFGENLQILAAAMTKRTRFVDYTSRREHLRARGIVPPAHWPELETITGIDMRDTARRRLLELWIWQQSTSGYWRAAPEHLSSGLKRGTWRRFAAALAPHADVLHTYIAERVLGQPVRPEAAHPSAAELLDAARLNAYDTFTSAQARSRPLPSTSGAGRRRADSEETPIRGSRSAAGILREWREWPTLTPGEARRVIDIARSRPAADLATILLLLQYGMPMTSIGKIERGDIIDTSTNQMHLMGQYRMGNRFRIPVGEPLRSALRTLAAAPANPSSLFPTGDALRRAIQRVHRTMKNAGATPDDPMGALILNHTFRALALDAGAEVHVVAAMTSKVAQPDPSPRVQREIARLPRLVLSRLGMRDQP